MPSLPGERGHVRRETVEIGRPVRVHFLPEAIR